MLTAVTDTSDDVLPLRMTQGADSSVVAVYNWYYLKPTKANMALLRVPIPPGYPRSG